MKYRNMSYIDHLTFRGDGNLCAVTIRISSPKVLMMVTYRHTFKVAKSDFN